MEKVTIKKIPFKLKGKLIEIGETLEFSALDRNGNEVSIEDIKGRVIISTFPDINTRICDEQTQWISKIATEHPNDKFLSISTDNVDTINKWCAANGLDNIDIWSDEKHEFGNYTNSLIVKVNKLARGFMLVEDGVIKDMTFNKEISSDPYYAKVEEWLK